MANLVGSDLVSHVAKLSRIAMGQEQACRFGDQLGAILAYFDKLQQLNTDGVAPMAHALELNNVLAEDEVQPGLTADQALANAPDRDGDFFKVPKVIGDSQ